MKLALTGSGVLASAAIVGAGVLAWWLYTQREKFDPTSAKNLAYQGANALVLGATGGAAAGGEDSIGGVAARFREWWSGDDARIREMLQGAPGRPGVPVTARGTADGYWSDVN